VKLDNPLVVQWEYASEERLAKRNQTYRDRTEGVNPDDAVFEAVREAAPERFLDVGCGMAELAERVQKELGAEVVAADVSPRMVELTRARGIDVHLGDVQSLPFGYENGEIALAPYLTQIERREANGTVVFPDRGSVVDFVAATTTRSHLADLVPKLTELFHTRSTHCVFVAGTS
jgi:SAM-dependent methyltransferase